MPDYKIVVLGSGGVGKSALTVQFVQGIFVEKYDPTIEDSYRKPVEVDGVQYMLEILDTAGTEQFTAMRDLYMKNAQGFVLVYSIVAQSTFNDLPDIREQILRVKDVDTVPMILVGNNCHLADQRVITQEQGQLLAKKFGNCSFFEASAKTKVNVDAIFFELIRKINSSQGHLKARLLAHCVLDCVLFQTLKSEKKLGNQLGFSKKVADLSSLTSFEVVQKGEENELLERMRQPEWRDQAFEGWEGPRDKDGNTLMHFACMGGKSNMVGLLFLDLMSFTSLNNAGLAPVMFASDKLISKHPQLKQGYLKMNPELVFGASSAHSLDLSKAGLTQFPPELVKFTSLTSLNLSGNTIQILPKAFAELSNLKEVKFPRSLIHPPLNIVEAGIEAVFGYLKEEKSTDVKRIKLMIVGQEEVGKTSLLHALVDKKYDPHLLSTDGIDIETLHLPSESKPMMTFDVWDFAGQKDYYTTHHFFLSQRSLFVLVFRVSTCLDKETDQIDFVKNRVIYWLESVRAHVGRNAQAILVGTFCDMASHDLLRKITMAVDDQLLGLFPDMIGREVGEENGRIVRRAALHFVTCGKHRSGIGEFRDALLNEALRHPAIKSGVPIRHIQLEILLEEERKRRGWHNKTKQEQIEDSCILRLDEIMELPGVLPPIEEEGEEGEKGAFLYKSKEDLQSGLLTLHALGSPLYFYHIKRANHLIFFNPQWLTKVMASLFTTSHKLVTKGVITGEGMAQALKGYPASLSETVIPTLFISFGVLAKMPPHMFDNSYLVPSLLPEEVSRASKEEIWPKTLIQHGWTELRRCMTLESCDRSALFGRLMAELFSRGTVQFYWRFGLFFELRDAFVKVRLKDHRSQIHIVVRSANALQRMKEVLDVLNNLLAEGMGKNVVAVERTQCLSCGYWIPISDCKELLVENKVYVTCQTEKRCRTSIHVILPECLPFREKEIDPVYLQMSSSVLGQGGFGKVMKGKLYQEMQGREPGEEVEDDSGTYFPVAIKQLLVNSESEAMEKFEEFRHELELMSVASHPNIIHLFGVSRLDGFFVLVMELAEGGALSSALYDPWGLRSVWDDKFLPLLTSLGQLRDFPPKGGVLGDEQIQNIVHSGKGILRAEDFTGKKISAANLKPLVSKGLQWFLEREKVDAPESVLGKHKKELAGAWERLGRQAVVFFEKPRKEEWEKMENRRKEFKKIHQEAAKDAIGGKIVVWLYEVACGMRYLHHRLNPPVIHRDLKPENVFLTARGQVKVADFGLSSRKEIQSFLAGTKYKFETASTPKPQQFQMLDEDAEIGGVEPMYLAPEILGGDEYGLKVDVYSYAYVIYELITHAVPFSKDNLSRVSAAADLAERVLNGQRPTIDKSTEIEYPALTQLMRDCWNQDPNERPTFEEIVLFLETKVENLQGRDRDGVATWSEQTKDLEIMKSKIRQQGHQDTQRGPLVEGVVRKILLQPFVEGQGSARGGGSGLLGGLTPRKKEEGVGRLHVHAVALLGEEREKNSKTKRKKEKGEAKKEKEKEKGKLSQLGSRLTSSSGNPSYVFFGGKVSGKSNQFGVACWKGVGEEVGVKRGVHQRWLQSLVAVSDEVVWSIGGDGIKAWSCSQSGTFFREKNAWVVEEKKGNQKETTVNSLDSKVFEDIAERWEKKRQEKDIWCRLIPLNPSLSVCEFVKGRGSLCEKVVGTKESCDVILKNDECAEKQCALLLIDGQVYFKNFCNFKGTYLNQHWIINEEKKFVRDGDVIKFLDLTGDFGFRIELPEFPSPPPKLCIPNDLFVIGVKVGQNIWLSSSLEGCMYIVPHQGDLVNLNGEINYSLLPLASYLHPLQPYKQVVSHITFISSFNIVLIAIRDILLFLSPLSPNPPFQNFSKFWKCFRVGVPDGVIMGVMEVKSMKEVWVWVDGGKILRISLQSVMRDAEKIGGKEGFCELSWDKKWCSYIEVGKDVTATAEIEEGVVWVGLEDGKIGCFQKEHGRQTHGHFEMSVRWLETNVSSFGVSQILRVGERHVWTWWKDGACVIWQ